MQEEEEEEEDDEEEKRNSGNCGDVRTRARMRIWCHVMVAGSRADTRHPSIILNIMDVCVAYSFFLCFSFLDYSKI